MASLQVSCIFPVLMLGACATLAPAPTGPAKTAMPEQGATQGQAKAGAAAATPKKPSPAVAPKARAPAAARKPASPPPAVAKAQAPAPLDLKTLEQRLKETPAIGVMTKLSLKNQVDDLVEKFRDYYQGRLAVTLAELRRPYDLLVMKVLALLQDGDPALARAIHASREAIWGILADRSKFEKLSS
jgi:hypothetical protein